MSKEEERGAAKSRREQERQLALLAQCPVDRPFTDWSDSSKTAFRQLDEQTHDAWLAARDKYRRDVLGEL